MKRLIGIAVATAVAAGLVAGFGVAGAVTETAIDEGPTELYSVNPCRVFDSRFPVDGAWGHNETRNLSVTDPATIAAQGGKDGGCGVPAGTSAVMLNVHALPQASGSVRVWPFGRIEPNAAVTAFDTGVRASNAISLPLCIDEGCEFDLTARVVFQNPADSDKIVHLIGDVVGYFLPAQPGPEGPQGPPGEDGADGQDGADGVSGYEVVGRTADRMTVPAGAALVIDTRCASAESSEQQQSEKAIGGGAQVISGTVTLNGSYPAFIEQVSPPDEDDPAGRWAAGGWAVQVTNTGDSEASVQPYVLCALLN